MKLTDIKVGMSYREVKKQIIKSENLVISCLPAFCNSDYDVVKNLDTKEKIYVLRNYDTGIITDITEDFNKVVNVDRAERNIKEILHNNGY